MNSNIKGVVLISVLLVVLLLSSVAVLMGNNYLISLKRAAYLEFQTTSLNIFRNVESLALKKINLELKFNSASINKQNPLLTNHLIFETEKGQIIGKISDASGCFNINALVLKTKDNYVENKKASASFRKFMSLKEVDNNLVEEMIDQVIDWIDLDSNPRAYGLEDYFYSGPLNNPKEYSGQRLFVSINELKGLPSFRRVNWKIFRNNFCALQENSEFSININTLEIKDAYLLSSLFPNLALNDAEYIITYLPKEGVNNLSSLSKLFPSMDFKSPNGILNFSTKYFNLSSKITFEEFSSESITSIYYGNNNNSYIISRIYNGI